MGILDEVIDGEKLMDRAMEVALREAPKVAPGPWGFIKVSQSKTKLIKATIVPRVHPGQPVRPTHHVPAHGSSGVLEATRRCQVVR